MAEREFTSNWTEGLKATIQSCLIPHFQNHPSILAHGKPKIDVLGIGIYEARCICTLYDLLLVPEATYLGIDQWHNEFGQARLQQAIRNTTEFKDQVSLVRGRSQAILPLLQSRSFDLIYIDGGHDYSSCLHDSLQAIRLIRHNGVIVWDDYIHPEYPGIKEAVDQIDSELATFEGKSQVKFVYEGWQKAAVVYD